MFDELSSEDEKKKWLFKENVRLQELSRNLEDERKLIEIQMGMLQRQQSKNMLLKKQLESQRDLFEQKWNIQLSELGGKVNLGSRLGGI